MVSGIRRLTVWGAFIGYLHAIAAESENPDILISMTTFEVRFGAKPDVARKTMQRLVTAGHSVSSPLDLADDTDVNVLRADHLGAWAFVQNTGEAALHFRETAAATTVTDRAHPLPVGAAIVVKFSGTSFWLWTPESGGQITVSPAAPGPVSVTGG